jgi:hypothetical protein
MWVEPEYRRADSRSREAYAMKKLLAPVFVLVFAVAATTPSLAATAQRVPLPDLSLAAPNVCTGNPTTVTLSNRILVIHDDVDPTGRQHVSGTVIGDIATADGFSGRFTITFGENVSGPVIVGEFRGFLDLTNSTFTLQNGSGALLLVHGVSHVTIPAGPVGEPKGEVEILSAECLGKPS